MKNIADSIPSISSFLALTVNAWFQLKGHTYLNKPVSCGLFYVC